MPSSILTDVSGPLPARSARPRVQLPAASLKNPIADGRMVCAVRVDLCIGCGLCVTLGNPTAPQQREFGCPPDYDAINMHPWDEVVKALQDSDASDDQRPPQSPSSQSLVPSS